MSAGRWGLHSLACHHAQTATISTSLWHLWEAPTGLPIIRWAGWKVHGDLGGSETGGCEGGVSRGHTHPPSHQGADVAPCSPYPMDPCLGRGVPDPVALLPTTNVHVTRPRESRGQWAGPAGILTRFPQSCIYPMSVAAPAAPSWALPPYAHTPDPMDGVCSPAPGLGAKDTQVLLPGLV